MKLENKTTKIRMSSIHKIKKATKVMLIVAVLPFLGLAQTADAGVVWLASDDGANLTISTSGSLNMGSVSRVDGYNQSIAKWTASSDEVYAGIGGYTFVFDIGLLSGEDPWILSERLPTTATGDSFGHHTTGVIWDQDVAGSTPGNLTPVTTMTFSGLTVATAFGTNLDAGEVVLWTHTETGDTISVALVPEPTTFMMLGLGFTFFIRRRNR